MWSVWPYPHTFTQLDSDSVVEFQYLRRLNGYLFEVQPVNNPSSKKLLVKFTQSYGHDVHNELARSGYAPELLGFRHLSGGWKMVVMEYLESPAWKNGSHDDVSMADEAIRRQLQVVRNQILPLLKAKGYVHGDIRPANIMFRVDGEGDEVKLIDFDFAGDEGQVTYPWDLNPECRPAVQMPCAPIKFDHDAISLRML